MERDGITMATTFKRTGISNMRKYSAVLCACLLIGCAHSKPPSPTAQMWAAGKLIHVPSGLPLIEGAPSPEHPARVHEKLLAELRKVGFAPVDSSARTTPVLKVTRMTRNSIEATVSLDGHPVDSFNVDVGNCTSFAWGVVADQNEMCLASGLVLRVTESSSLRTAMKSVGGDEPSAPVPVQVAKAGPPQGANVAPAQKATDGANDPALVSAAPQPGAYALIIGIDRYRDVPGAPGARADAEAFARIARKTLGLKDDHIQVALDDRATRSDVLRGLQWLKQNVAAGGRVYFFYSGHGAPATDQSTYLLPFDGNPKDLADSAVPMSEVMKKLGETGAKEVLAMVDACFSGAGGRSVLPPGARPLMRVKEAEPTAHMALFSASQGDEISGPATGGGAGVFTKYVTTALGTGQADINGDGQVSLQELSDWVTPRVAREARTDNREQHPRLIVGNGVGSAGNFIIEYGLATK